MDDPERIALILDLVRTGEPLAGSLAQPGEPPRQFTGVLELLALVELARAGTGAQTHAG